MTHGIIGGILQPKIWKFHGVKNDILKGNGGHLQLPHFHPIVNH